jgi:hypothetical protein
VLPQRRHRLTHRSGVGGRGGIRCRARGASHERCASGAARFQRSAWPTCQVSAHVVPAPRPFPSSHRRRGSHHTSCVTPRLCDARRDYAYARRSSVVSDDPIRAARVNRSGRLDQQSGKHLGQRGVIGVAAQCSRPLRLLPRSPPRPLVQPALRWQVPVRQCVPQPRDQRVPATERSAVAAESGSISTIFFVV